ncbi:MAG: triose-phosphate isomerase [Alphaproteobacteria bacterium]|nr:triose-phosphate isomerase [Hyphomonas sp.]MBR9805782.1 triose-phosphate isomerase [Alphaproteobacteria bacterium]|tara:strand:- start:677 stop:1426 length:750 start_codon:yes stop_codon:yes gene_type:complete
MARTLIAGNWKMNGLKESLGEIRTVASELGNGREGVEVLLCVPATLLALAAEAAEGSALMVGGETCHPKASGAHTGDISAEMLADAGASHVIVGHSERRMDHAESNETVAAQAEAALRAGLTPIICIGESLEQRKAGETLDFVASQIKGSIPTGADAEQIVIAYEPIWAIGTGEVASVEQIDEVHRAIRARLGERFGPEKADLIPLLYGGSMKPDNAGEILAVDDVNGGLIGGASLKAADFLAIYAQAK